ncbi:DUF190 domain-containing protein [Rubrobacter indicoceani]|uniref:DUF190 domain-containing protein n=1 Tax=Rubrobacter indicoceani TaxID=2051957 RepID=UPI000E5B334B|nr:DUF190 domain-containing protein [Rubrobacter indicoceani]
MDDSDRVDALRLMVYLGDSARQGWRPLFRQVVGMLHEEGIAGATVLHGIEGYGGDRWIHTASVLDLSSDLPVIIIAVDRREKIEKVIPRVEALVERGLVTIEEVKVILSRPVAL